MKSGILKNAIEKSSVSYYINNQQKTNDFSVAVAVVTIGVDTTTPCAVNA
jgi:hypothetical protein